MKRLCALPEPRVLSMVIVSSQPAARRVTYEFEQDSEIGDPKVL